MPQLDWQARLVGAIADEIRRRRENRRMSAQQLATACTKLGLSISRSTLADLENGRRTTLTVAELIVISAALEIAPLRLLVPLDNGNVEMLPGAEINPWKATRDFAGLDSEEARLFDQFLHVEQALRDQVASAASVFERPLGPRDLHVQMIQGTLAQLVQLRQRFTERGLTAPEIPDGDLSRQLESILGQSVSTERNPTPESAAAPAQQPIVAAIVTSTRGVLVTARKDGKPPWGFVTGEVEPGELAEDAAVREVKEETGLEVRAGQVIGERDHPATGRHMIYMAAEPVRGTSVFVGDEAELAEVRWVSLTEAGELLPGMYKPVREYLVATIGAGSDS